MGNIIKLYILILASLNGVSGAYEHWKEEIYPKNLDDKVCCNESMCGCEGVTIREYWLKRGRE